MKDTVEIVWALEHGITEDSFSSSIWFLCRTVHCPCLLYFLRIMSCELCLLYFLYKTVDIFLFLTYFIFISMYLIHFDAFVISSLFLYYRLLSDTFQIVNFGFMWYFPWNGWNRKILKYLCIPTCGLSRK